nr:MmcQ/YjbR family DNA-binding protein [uncultured Pseudomonas sp.]
MSEASLSQAQVVDYCLSLPGARQDVKWGSTRVFSVAGNKMFAVLDLAGAGLSFKVEDERFLGYCDRPGVRPAPYLARARWISLAPPYAMSSRELLECLQCSHQLVVRRLPKRLQAGLKL